MRLNKNISQKLLVVLVILAIGVYKHFSSSPDSSTSPSDLPLPTSQTISPQPLPVTAVPTTGAPQDQSQKQNFDFYLLSLSWSPEYCSTSGSDDLQQCSLGKKLGFVLHGLWPQYNQGYPSSCSTEKLPDNIKQKFPGLFPSDKLYTHEWEKHGTCSGLSPQEYFSLAGQIKNTVNIPTAFRSPAAPFRTTVKEVQAGFVAANPGFGEASFAVNCTGSGRYLTEVRVCFSKDGKPTNCSAEVQKSAAKSCQSPDFLVKNVR
jgi:ribonuclease T2